jgi:hypothetical protein
MHLKASSCRIFTTRWFLPVFSIALGLALGGAQWKGGDLQTGLSSLALFVAIAAVLFWGGRSETIRMIRGDGRDERWARIDVAATAISGFVVLMAIIVACGWEWAHGRDGSPYVALGALGGVTYIASLLILRARS